MSMKFRLFASVAAPVLSLPLMLQPVHAFTPGMAGDVARPASGIIQVQQPEIIPEEGQGRERPRRERSEGEGGGERQQRREQRSQEDGGERPQRRQAQEREQQQERPQRRQQAEEQQQERPQRRQQAEEQQQERPQRRQQAEEQQQERPQRRQQAEEQQQERPQRRQQAEEQQQERPQRRQQAEEQQQERPQRRQQAEEQQQQERQQRREQRVQENNGGERPQRRLQAEEQQQQDRQQRREQQGAQENNGSVRQQRREAQEAERQQQERRQAREAEQQQDRERDQRRQAQDAEQQPNRDRDQADTRPRREPPRTPEQVERAREVARDPSRARDGEQVVLPVENGAAVLDSAKERRPDRDRRDGDRPRRDRDSDRQAEQRERPRSDRDAQANDRVTQEERDRWRESRREITEQRGERLDRRPDFERPRGWDVRGPARGGDRNWDRDGGRDDRVIISIDNQSYVRHNDNRRFYRDGGRPEYERLDGGRYREIVERPDGTRIVTVRNRYGEVVQRTRVVRGGDEYVLYYAPTLLEDRRDDYVWRDPGDDLPPMRLTVPVEEYIIDTSSEPDRDYYEFLEQPPVEHVERAYSLDEVRYSSRIRDKVPRIDLDTVTFATGSAEIPMNQASSLRKVADAINKVLDKDPSETFLIEGHTDAVGSDESNLVLSDERAESVAVVLTDAFGIPPENLTTQGYGERYLKVDTQSANQENRRVTIRRITPLVKPVASNQ